MDINIQKIPLTAVASHRDLRCGLGLPSYISYVNEFKSNGNKYPLIKLGKVISLEYGSALKEGDRIPGDYPVMGSNGVVGMHSEYLVEGPAIIVGRKGSAGEVTYIAESCFPIDTTFYVKLKGDLFDLKFLYLLLKQLRLQRLALFKGVPGLNRFDAYEAYIPIIPMDEQREVLKTTEQIEVGIQSLQNQIKNKENKISEVIENASKKLE